MNKLMYVVYLILITSLSVFLSIFMIGPMFGIFFVRTSIFFLIIAFLIPTIWPFGIRKTISYFREVFTSEKSGSGEEAINYFKKINVFILILSLFTFFLCTISTLALINDPKIYGPNLATTLTVPLYSAYLSIAVFLPFRFVLEKKYDK